MLPQNRCEVEALVKSSGASFGVAWDADADRVMFFDEDGEFISGAYITALLASLLLEKYGHNNKIIFDPRVIWPTMKVVKELGGQSIISKGGHAFIKDRMRKENALFAGEMSAHYYFRDNFYADNGMIPFLLVLEHLSKQDRPFSAIMRPFTEGHYMSGEVNYHVPDVQQAINAVRDKFGKNGKEDFTDGYSLEGDGWRFNIRGSNTEPLLRLNIEAREQKRVDHLRSKIEEVINARQEAAAS
jgi:phosphomannomutase